MPRGTTPAPTGNSTALALPDDIRNDLLRAQAEQITTVQRLPEVKIMNAGAGMYEFSDTGDTVREFVGIILNSHARNLLWDRPFGAPLLRDPVTNEEVPNLPACSASDGRYGTPRIGFPHAGLGGRAATGAERIACATCPYNQWESKSLIPALVGPNGPGKGKATTNQRILYIMVLDAEGNFVRETPVQLTLPATSLTPYDEYLGTLLNRSIPIQAVVTRFAQVRTTRGANAYAIATFENSRMVTEDEFGRVMGKRAQFRMAITPQDSAAANDEPSGYDADAETSASNGEEDDDLPF